MKKQIFLLTSLLLAGAFITAATSVKNTTTKSGCCKSSCSSSCSSSSSSSCSNDCALTHGQTFRRIDNQFQNGTPLFESLWSTNVIRNLENDDKHGGLELVVFGGKNVKNSESARYFFPYGFSSYNFDGSVTTTAQTFAHNIAWTQAVSGGTSTNTSSSPVVIQAAENNGEFLISSSGTLAANTAYFSSDASTYQFDSNKVQNKLLPWNFGITYAALFEPLGASEQDSLEGTGLIQNPTFKSTICPKYFYSHVGGGFALRYQFSDDKQGFFARISTSVENVKSKICLNENVTEEKTALTSEIFPAQGAPYGVKGSPVNTPTSTSGTIASDNPYGEKATEINAASIGQPFVQASDTNPAYPAYVAAVDPTGSINAAYINNLAGNKTSGTFFPTEQEGLTNQGTPATPPANAEEAFRQSAWKYGKMGCQQSVTRLADIELAFGYQWLCSDCASNNWYVGIIIPTGNKPCAEYVAPAVVGNGQHVGLMCGSSLELMLSENECRSVWYRLDTNSRYLFNNTQKRSFDLKGNEWSRYMMVWENQEAYTAALAVVNTIIPGATTAGTLTGQADRNYTPGINVFTADMKVTPRFQFRLNQAVYFQSEKFKAELGWNIFARSKECVKFACSWDSKPAFADSSFISGVGLNNNRTIYNDAQTMSVNQAPNLFNGNGAAENVINLAGNDINTTATQGLYENFAITQDQVNLDSAATPAAILNTPYATLGYTWGCGDHKPVVSVGGQYEFSTGNNTLNQWMVWGKFEFAF